MRPHGGRRGEAQPGDLVVHPLVGQPGRQRIGPTQHLLRGTRLGRLRAHLVGLGAQRVDLALGVGPLAVPATLVGLALLQVGLPAEVVDVDRGAVRVEVPDLVDDGVEQFDVVADDDEPAVVLPQEVAQPRDRVGVEVVGRFVEQQRRRLAGGVGEQDAREFDATALAAGQRAQRLGQHAVGQAEVGADPRGLALCRVAAERGEALLEIAVAADERVVVGLFGEPDLRLGDVADEDVETACGQHPVARDDVEVAGARVLRQVADGALDLDPAGVRRALAGEHAHGRGLTGAVAADEADAVVVADAKADGFEQDARAGAQLEVGGGDHFG